MKYELDLNDEQYQHLNEILEKAREDELNSIPDITDTNAFSGVSDITNIQDSLKIQHDERDRSGDINKILEQKFQEAFGREGTDDIDRLVQNPEFLQAFAQGIERLKQEPLEVSSHRGGAKERIQRNLEVLKRTNDALAGREDGDLEELFDQADQIMDKPIYSEVQDLDIEQVKGRLGTLDTQIKTLDPESQEYIETVHASRQLKRAVRAEIEKLDDQLNWDLDVYSPEFDQAEERKAELKQILGSPTSQGSPTNQGITIDQLKAELEKAASRADELSPLSSEHKVAVKWHVAIENALKAKEMELGLELSTPEQADMDKGLPPGYSRDPAALEALLDAKGLHPVDKNQQPHPDIEFFQEIHEATEKHGDGDYGITDLELGEDYTLRSTYSGGRIFKDNETIVEFESPYSERGGIGHPIVVTGQVTPELKEFILEQVKEIGLDRANARDALEPLANDWKNTYVRASNLLNERGVDELYIDGSVDNKTDTPFDIDLEIERGRGGEITICERQGEDTDLIYCSHVRANGEYYPMPRLGKNVTEQQLERVNGVLDRTIDIDAPSRSNLYTDRLSHGVYKPQEKTAHFGVKDQGSYTTLSLEYQGLKSDITLEIKGDEPFFPVFEGSGYYVEGMPDDPQFCELLTASLGAEYDYKEYPEFNDLTDKAAIQERIDHHLEDLKLGYIGVDGENIPKDTIQRLVAGHQESYEKIVGDFVQPPEFGVIRYTAPTLHEHAINYMGLGASIKNEAEKVLPAKGDRREVTVIQTQDRITIQQKTEPGSGKAFDTLYQSHPSKEDLGVDYELTEAQEADLARALQGKYDRGLSLDEVLDKSMDEPALTLEDTLPGGYEDEMEAERYDPYIDVDPEIDNQYQDFMFDTVSSHLLENGIEQDGERWLELGSDYIASVSINGDNLEISKDQEDGRGFKLAYVQQSAHEPPTLNDLEPSEVMDVTRTVLDLEVERPTPTAQEIADEFGLDIVEVPNNGEIPQTIPDKEFGVDVAELDHSIERLDPDEVDWRDLMAEQDPSRPPRPTTQEIADEFGVDIVEPSDQGPKGGNNTNFLELTQSAVLDHGSMDKGEPPTISLELADGHTVTAWEDSVFISRENNGKANILYWGDRDEIKDLLTDEAKESITAGITGLNNRSLAQDFGVDVNREPEQEISIFDMVAQPPESVDMESMDAVIARDTYGTAVEILTPGPERDANEAKRIAAQFKEPPSQYALDVVEHLKQNSEQDVPSATSGKSVLVGDVLKEALEQDSSTTQVEKPFKAVPDFEVTTGEATQKRHQANREFFDAMTKATTQHSEPSKGAHQLKLSDDLTSTVVKGQLIISRGDGRGNQDVVYGHSRETAHLSGTGDGHIDRLSAQEKSGALKHVHSLGVPKDLSNYKSSKSQSRSSRSRQNKSRDSGFDR